VSVDVVVTATAFLDLTFIGLEALPSTGEERFAGDLMRSPGGGAINAIGAARLGLSAALASPLGQDLEGEFIRGELEREGIELIATGGARTPTTVVMPWGGERAMVTYQPGITTRAADVAAFSPRAVVVGLNQLDVVPDGVPAYATCGDDDARAFAGRPPGDLDHARGLFVNRREAHALTGARSLEDAAAQLAECVEIAIVTCGPDGAMACVDSALVPVPGFAMDAVDTTGAGDLLCSAFVWADLAGADVETALRWAVLYGSLSVTVATGAAGAVSLERLVDEGTSRGLPPLGALTTGGTEGPA
jgi:sugar/nucleoside kinase (ribokinase family)